MVKTNDELLSENLEAVKRLLILNLSHHGIEGKRIAAVLEVDAATISRILSPKTKKKKRK